MSEESIAVLVTAQQQATKLQLSHVTSATALVGCLDHPEQRAVERTMEQYRLTYRAAVRALEDMYDKSDGQNGSSNKDAGWLSGFRAARQGDAQDRPFDSEFKATLVNAGKLADQMQSETIQVSHILLALLGYRETKQGNDDTVIECGADRNEDDNRYGGWTLIRSMNVLDEDVKAVDICTSLLSHLKETSSSGDSSVTGPELVTGVAGGNQKTPTLSECGVDLTQQAKDGLLDPVYGRDKEIQSCLRTLLRRRKNCVCLIGDPGVGKTAIAEGVAQILATGDDDEDDDNIKGTILPCPKPLRKYRLISLELASIVAGTKYRGEFEERLQAIVKEVTDPKAPPTILFIDEIHNLVGAGAAEGR